MNIYKRAASQMAGLEAPVDRSSPLPYYVHQDIIPASPKIARYLNLEPNTPVICIERLRFVQAEPIVLVTKYLPYALCPDLLREDLTRQSLYACLERRFGLVIARGRRSLEAVQANEDEAHLLRVPVGAALIMLDSVGYLSNGTVLEYYHALYRGDRSRFEVELTRMHEAAAAGATTNDPHRYLQDAGIVAQADMATNRTPCQP